MRQLAVWISLSVPALLNAAPLEYNRDIRPILSENCFSCHGFDEKARKANLRLDVADKAYAERDGVTALTPGDLHKSEAWKRIVSEDAEELMPPPKSHLKLTSADKEKLKQWIQEGAKYDRHWSFLPPKRVLTGSAGAIDTLIRERLAQEGLSPSPPADKATLIRRLSLDLTGLPPSAAEVHTFVNSTNPLAYEALVDRLLKSAHFGERMALEWLDAARYADTNGFSIDGGRHMWLWRDWVIQAFNENKPYDRFLIEQLAGDLLPERTPADLIATGFQRNNMVTHEGGTIPEENLTNYNADRVKTLGETILGLTLGCAQCHDHKFDPISQQEYFQLFAFFNTLGDRGLDGNAGINPGPFIEARTPLKTNAVPDLQTRLANLEEFLARPDAALLADWERQQQALLAKRGRDFQTHPALILKVSTPNRGGGIDIESNSFRLKQAFELGAFDVSIQLPKLAKPVTGLRITVHPVTTLPGGGWGHGPADKRAAQKAGAPAANPSIPKGSFMLTSLSATSGAIASDQINLHKLERIVRTTANSWDAAHPPVGCLDPRNESGWSPDLAAEGPVRLTATFGDPIHTAKTGFLTAQLVFGHGKKLTPEHVELEVTTGEDDDSDLPAEILRILKSPNAQRTQAEKDSLWTYCAGHSDALARARTELANLRERLEALTQSFPTMVMNVAEKPRETFVLERGDYAKPTMKVFAGTPQALPPMPEGAPVNRLGLAQWLTMKDHPLTARVAVNRFWKMLFGIGIVATPADFGSQGEWPSHPELLDWLASEFTRSGWDVKNLLKRIVLSDTYQQSSVSSRDLLERDPQNRLLARGPRFRLPAELVRDAALKASGLLAEHIGGPSVNPYSPGDLWREVSHYGSSPATAQTFVQDHGEKLYRRSLYTYWKRTAPPPNMSAFDAPNREVCTVARSNTTTPLQALVTLNDPQFVEAARALGQRALQQPGNDSTRLRWAFLEALSREPKPGELRILTGALARERTGYAAKPDLAQKVLSVGESARDPGLASIEHAAWMQVASLILNLSEAVTRN
jgi:hypothetical protein